MEPSPDYLGANRAYWETRHEDEVKLAKNRWSAEEPVWGTFAIPESVAGFFPESFDGLHTVELGCGSGYVSAWMARRGAKAIAIDPTTSQLRIARSSQKEFGLEFPLVQAAGESTPFADGSFDFAISEYGAAIWADPYRWVPEASRLLRPGAQLIVLRGSTLVLLCLPDEEFAPATEHLHRPQFGMHRLTWPDDPSTEFHLPHGDWIRLLRSCGFDIEDLIELRPPEGSVNAYGITTLEWARRWPCEEVWIVRKR